MEAMRERATEEASLGAIGEFRDDSDTDLRALLKGELEPGERLLWAGRSYPVPVRVGLGFYLWGAFAIILLILSVIVIAAFASALRHDRQNEPAIGTALGLFAIACGIILGLIAQWNQRRNEFRRKSNILYAVTERRAIVWTPERKSDAIWIKSVHRGQISDLERVQRPDGSGNLIFFIGRVHQSPEYHFDRHFFGFQDIHDVRRVEQIVRNNLVSVDRTA